MNACIWHFAGSQIMFLTSTTRITADGENSKALMIRSHYGLRPKIRLTVCGIFLSSAELCCGPQSLTARPKLCNTIFTAAKKIWPPTCFRFIKGNFPPWSEDRRRQSDTRHETPLIQTFKETAEIRQQTGKKKKSQKRRT